MKTTFLSNIINHYRTFSINSKKYFQTAIYSGIILLFGIQATFACSLSFTSPSPGSTSSTANVIIKGTGSGTANPGDSGSATLYQNGTAVFNISGVFTGFVNFFESRGVPVTLVEGDNYFVVTGSVGGCSASASMTIYYKPPADKELGIEDKKSNCQKNLAGNPINLFNGNNVETQTDVFFSSPFAGGLKFERYYNSQSSIDSAMGHGWSHSYAFTLYQNVGDNENRIKVLDNTGRGYYFQNYDGDDEFEGEFSEISSVTISTDGNYVWEYNNFSYEFSSASGLLLSISDPKGNTQTLSYTPDSLVRTVNDQASGRVLTFHYNSENRISSITGPVTSAVSDGVWVSYEYDTAGNLTKAIYSDDGNGSTKSGFQYRYEDSNDANNMTAKYDLSGCLISSWSYNGQDMAIENVNREGKGVSVNFNDPGNVVVTDAYGLSNTYEISQVAGQQKITGKTGASNCNTCSSGIVSAEFDETSGLPLKREWANGRIDYFQNYDENANPGTWIISADTDEEKTITTAWHPVLPAPLSRTQKSLLADDDNPDRTRSMVWDYDDPSSDGNTDTPNENPTNLIYRMILQGFTHNDSGSVIEFEQITIYTYNDKGQVLSVNGPLDGEEDTVFFTYDSSTGDLLTMTRPLTGTTFFTYDAAGNMVTATDENGIQTSVTYDGRNRWLTKTSNNASTTRTFNTGGELASLTDRAGIALSLSYNTKGFLKTVADPAGNYISHAYDENGNPVDSSIYTVEGVRTLYRGRDYGDPATDPGLAPGKPAKTLAKNQDNTANLETLFAYEHGNLVQITDPLAAVKDFTYDSLNRVIQAREQQSANVIAETGYVYDTNNNLTQVTDPEGRISAYTYDDANRLVKEISPDRGTTTYLYDAAGNLMTKTTGDGAVVQYTYDVLGRMLTTEYPDTGLDVIFTYDEGENGVGRLTGVNNGEDVYEFSYDASGNLITLQRTTDLATFVTTYTYDADGRLTGMVYPDSRTVTYALDATGRILNVTTEKDGTTQPLASGISYRPFGPAASMTLGTGQQVATEFDLNYRPVTLSTGEVVDYAFHYDDAGRITGITDNLSNDRTRGFGYDSSGRLIAATGSFGSRSFTYDKTGNRLTRTLDEVVQTYTYTPGTNKLTQITDADGSTSLTYDTAGRMKTKGDLSFEYTDAGRMLKTLKQGTQVQEAIYNSFGQRTRKTAGGVTTLYHYDLSGRLIAESSADGTIIRQYVYLDDQLLTMIISDGALAAQFDSDADKDVDGLDLALALDADPALIASVFGSSYSDDSESIYYYQNDHLGSPVKLLDEGGEVVWDGDYTPSGQVDVRIGRVQNLFRFPGQYFDAETGLHYNWHRYYDPETGRYLTPDPIGLAGGINPFVYVEANPINSIDPLGLLNLTKTGVGFVNSFRGVTGVGAGVVVIGAGTATIPLFGDVVATPAYVFGSVKLATGFANFNKGMGQIREAVDEPFAAASFRNLLGLAPFGQKFDDPCEPGPREYFKGIWNDYIKDPISTAKRAIKDFFAFD
jgi:RHS repeat-associated protein